MVKLCYKIVETQIIRIDCENILDMKNISKKTIVMKRTKAKDK